LQDNILIDFFLTIGLPDYFIHSVFDTIEKEFGGCMDRDVFQWMKKKIDEEIKLDKHMIQNLYPDCLKKTMNKDDPRYNYLDEPKIN